MAQGDSTTQKPGRRLDPRDAIVLLVLALMGLAGLLLGPFATEQRSPRMLPFLPGILSRDMPHELLEHYRTHGEYPEELMDAYQVSPLPPVGSRRDNGAAIPPSYFTAKDENGKRFACLLVWPAFDYHMGQVLHN